MKRKQIIFLAIVFFLMALILWFYQRVIYNPPIVAASTVEESDLVKINDNYFKLNESWLRLNEYGNWECYIEGNGFERGRTLGILQKQLAQHQEAVFIDEIQSHVPSWWLRKALIVGIGWFNRDLDQQIPLEYREEIYGISQFFSDEYDYIGPKFNRVINYHAAHDIGHALQNMRLVGCTAFGTWQFDSTNQQMIVGRNFDFYFGDEFAKNKIVLLSNPDRGYKYISVTWAGFTGVVSGLNEKGLGITLNADKSEIPSKSGTPVSIIARDILQYAANIDEAIAISNKYKSFVSESFTISSAIDKTIVVIEKTPDTTGIYRTKVDTIIVTNHFQSSELKDSQINIEHMAKSESVSRYNRSKELIRNVDELNYTSMAGVLRNQQGLGNENIGMGNPLAINQLIAHHAVIFENTKKLIWVSAYPFVVNVMQAYSVDDFSSLSSGNVVFPVTIDSLLIDHDPFYKSEDYLRFSRFSSLRQDLVSATEENEAIGEEWIRSFIDSNPEFYQTYLVVGNYYFEVKQFDRARKWYKIGLSKEVAYFEDQEFMEERIKEIESI